MPKHSAGLILYRRGPNLQVLLAHPGGPFYARKDLGVWSIPKGEADPGEDLLAAARREFQEELGFSPDGELVPLGSVTLKSGKIVHAWAIEGDWDPTLIKSNAFPMEWPPHSGKQAEFPEVDRAQFFDIEEARRRINPAQAELLTRLQQHLLPHGAGVAPAS
jgi:predicted NUDIX family NTP pyrophosphohydrolase